jgi:hypothetical protein
MASRGDCDREYDFILILTGVTELSQHVVDSLFEAGCDDGTISLQWGRVIITFSRTAPSLYAALLSAIRDVRSAGIGADVLRIDDCSLVTQAEIARKIDRSRQQVHQYITGVRGPGNFPPPACNLTDGVPLWYWCEVAYWLRQNDMIRQDAALQAQEIAMINAVLELKHLRKIDPEKSEEILRSLEEEPVNQAP